MFFLFYYSCICWYFSHWNYITKKSNHYRKSKHPMLAFSLPTRSIMLSEEPVFIDPAPQDDFSIEPVKYEYWLTRSLLARWSWLTGLYTKERDPLTLSFHSPLGVKSFPPQLILQLLGKIIHLSCISARSLNTAHNGHAPSSELGSRDCLSFPTCKTFSSQAFCWLAHNVKVKGICGESDLGCALPVQIEEQSKLEGCMAMVGLRRRFLLHVVAQVAEGRWLCNYSHPHKCGEEQKDTISRSNCYLCHYHLVLWICRNLLLINLSVLVTFIICRTGPVWDWECGYKGVVLSWAMNWE